MLDTESFFRTIKPQQTDVDFRCEQTKNDFTFTIIFREVGEWVEKSL